MLHQSYEFEETFENFNGDQLSDQLSKAKSSYTVYTNSLLFKN